ncbi:uncharacterized protein LOC111542133 [Piliocolobus tephrosceles]|uniref:uncharacterized protein LOC111542133 n=1 Tax=Piliocolobus tephrosceles TaxID=591936 RepID=UPI000C2A31EF|nr:uncharacterized protein LOC111542133 [Piliocolobus tephrosceles]
MVETYEEKGKVYSFQNKVTEIQDHARAIYPGRFWGGGPGGLRPGGWPATGGGLGFELLQLGGRRRGDPSPALPGRRPLLLPPSSSSSSSSLSPILLPAPGSCGSGSSRRRRRGRAAFVSGRRARGAQRRQAMRGRRRQRTGSDGETGEEPAKRHRHHHHQPPLPSPSLTVAHPSSPASPPISYPCAVPTLSDHLLFTGPQGRLTSQNKHSDRAPALLGSPAPEGMNLLRRSKTYKKQVLKPSAFSPIG